MAQEILPGIVQENPDAVSLDDSKPEDNSVSLPVPGVNEQPLTPEIAAQRAAKTKIGLGQVLRDKTDEEIYQQYAEGQENMLRKEAATRLDFDKQMARQKELQDIATSKGGLTPDDVGRVMDPNNPKYIFSDPSSVMEEEYAKRYLSTLNTARSYLGLNLVTNAGLDMPQQVQDTLADGSELLTKNQYILTRMQNTEQNLVDKQSWPGYLADQAKQLFQPYNEYNERGLIEGSGVLSGIGLGSNLDEQHAVLYKLPLPDFKEKFDTAMDYLEKKNPSLAVAYAKSLLSQNTFDATVNNAMTGLMVPDYLGIGKLGTRLLGNVKTLNQVRKATKDIIQSAARDPNAGSVQALEGAGDVQEAAVLRTARDNLNAQAGSLNPIEAAKDKLLSTWQDIQRKFTANPGTYLSRELSTRIADDITRDGEELFQRIGEMNRVERAPGVLTDPDAIRAIKEKYKDNYRGPQNTILDISDPIKEPTSNTYWFKVSRGNYDATLFADEATAQGFADQNGLTNVAIKGASPEKLYLPEVAAKNIESIKQTPTGTRFYTDHGIEVVSSPTPKPGHIPYNLKTNKFEGRLTEESAHIEQQGLGFYLEHWVPLRETDDMFRDLLIKNTNGEVRPDAISTNSATGTRSVMNALLGWVRNSDETMSVNESAQRKAATYTQSNIQLWAKGLYQDLEDIASGRVREDPVTGEKLSALSVYPKSWFGKITNREIAQQFERALDFGRKAIADDGQPGRFFQNPGELQDFYQRSFRRDPSYLETRAYFNFVKLIEGDRMLREVAEFRNRARLGTEQHALSALNPETEETVTSPFFDGISKKEWPNEGNILLMSKNLGDESVYELGHINDKMVRRLKENVQSGVGKIIQIYDKDHQPLSEFSDVARNKIIHYVYTENAESKAIEFNHVQRREGGHFEWDYDHYLKQADVRPQYPSGINDKRKGVLHYYVGDTTVMPIKNRRLGENVAKIWNEAQGFIKNGEWDKAKPLVAKLGIKWDEFTGWYHPTKDAGGNVVRPARLNPNEPIQVVAKNKQISQMGSELQDRYRIPKPEGGYRDTFVDDTKRGPANNFKVQYNTERNTTDFRTINDVGSQGNPVYAHQPADMVDPLTTMNRALNRVVNSTFMDDYKIYTAEHWLAEAAPYLDASKNELRSSPFFWFQNPKYRAGVDKTMQWNLESNRYKAMTFTGVPNRFDTFIHSLTSNLADKFYERYGPEANRSVLQKARTIVPIYMLHHVTDPVSWMRSVTFNFKLGLFAIPQFLVQAQTHSLIWALEPKHGTVGTFGMLLHNWAKFTDNPAILAKLDDYATKLNMGSRFRPGEFLEARRELEKAGFEHVAGEYSNINNQLKTRFIQNDFDKGLKIGQYPFRLGEQSTRQTAWYTAFREFRDSNPNTPIGNIERSKILNKADLLTVNMSRASSSGLNEGVFSLSTQFLTYQIKLAELFLGKRLGATPTERWLARARIMTMFTALYGLPNAIGVTGAPFSDNFREHFMDDLGYIPGEKWLSTMVNEGIPAWTTAMITGQLPNTGDRFGSQGFQNIKQALRGDIPWWQAVGGASTSVMGNFVSSVFDPYTQYALSWARGDREPFTIKSADLVEPLKEISSVSTAAKWWTAMQTGKWVSKNENYVTDVTPLQATLYGLTGMSPQEQDDIFIQNKMVQGEKDAKKAVLKDFIKDWRRGIEAKANGDSDQGNAYFRNAIARATTVGMSGEEINTAQAIANRSYERAIDQSDINVWKEGNINDRDARLQQYKRKLDMKDQGLR